MPAVTYHLAIATMAERGDEIFVYLEDMGLLDDSASWLPTLSNHLGSWGELCVWWLSCAVEWWAFNMASAYEEGDVYAGGNE